MKTAYFNRFTIDLPDQCVTDCHHQGACDDDVDYWQRIKGGPSFEHISDEALAAELKEYGAWSNDELRDRDENERRIIWLAAGNIQDEERENENAPE